MVSEYSFHARFYDNKKRERYTFYRFDGDEYQSDIWLHDEPSGALLLDFLNLNLSLIDSFKSFFKKWGYSGFEGLTDISFDDFNDNKRDQFYNEILNANGSLNKAQSEFRATVNYCFNTDRREHLSSITPKHRFFVYSEILNNDISEYYKNVILSFSPSLTDIKEYVFTFDNKLEELDAISYVCGKDVEMYESYNTNSLLTICYLELMFYIQNNDTISKCGNCKKYFVPSSRITEVYCDNCKDVGYVNKVKNDQYMTAYRNEYKSRNAKLRTITNDDRRESERSKLKAWGRIVRYEVEKAKRANMPIEEFKQWLKIGRIK